MSAIEVHRVAVTRPILIAGGLAVVVAGRWAATVSSLADGLTIGLGFGLALAIVAIVGGWRPDADRWRSVAVGLGGGAFLVAVALLSRDASSVPFASPAVFGPWVVVTILVATTEEAILRGALFDAFDGVAGTAAAVVLTSLLFGLMHVPLYGWHVVPLDVGVGLFLAGLRLGTGGFAAPALAHASADLATWWL